MGFLAVLQAGAGPHAVGLGPFSRQAERLGSSRRLAGCWRVPGPQQLGGRGGHSSAFKDGAVVQGLGGED